MPGPSFAHRHVQHPSDRKTALHNEFMQCSGPARQTPVTQEENGGIHWRCCNNVAVKLQGVGQRPTQISSGQMIALRVCVSRAEAPLQKYSNVRGCSRSWISWLSPITTAGTR
ncbi:hypothetical protein CGRA01v4_03303 [Colletotrichum graminicola]|nr:hypothetical protein CGRA01v4_03303 [Colletotrichum graminicola]